MYYAKDLLRNYNELIFERHFAKQNVEALKDVKRKKLCELFLQEV